MSLCFIVLFIFLYNIVSGQLALLLLINDDELMSALRIRYSGCLMSTVYDLWHDGNVHVG